MPRLTTLPLILLILLFHSSSGEAVGIGDGVKPVYAISEVNARKLLREITVDYDYGGPNPKHDPKRGGKPGPGGKAP